MTPLASITDVEARLTSSIPSGDLRRVQSLINDASAAVRAEVRQNITEATYAVTLGVRSDNTSRFVVLPQRPVVSVESVATIDDEAVSYEWDGRRLHVSTLLPAVVVEYTAGLTFDTDTRGVLDAVAGIVANVAARAYGTPVESSGKTAETISQYSYTVGSGAAQGGFGLLRSEKSALAQLFGKRRAGSIPL